MQKLIDAIPECDERGMDLRDTWATHMAINAGCHPWPNANHRTALLSFNYALADAKLPLLGFPTPESGHDLIARSHEQRDSDGGEYTLEELLDADHVYRRLFREFSEQLVSSA